MLPNHAPSSTVLPGGFLSPRGTIRSATDQPTAPLSIGGAGFRDTSQGLNSQVWTGSFDGDNVILTPQSGAAIAVEVGDCVWFDFCFDQSMNPVVAWASSFGTSFFRWFDSTVNNFTITTLPGDTDPWPYCQLDDPRPSQSSASDVIIAYTRSSHLRFLAQRDRYGVEYDMGAVPAPKVLTQVGMSTVNRFQFQFNALLPDLESIYGKFVPAEVFSTIVLMNVGNIRPKIYAPKEDVTVRTRK